MHTGVQPPCLPNALHESRREDLETLFETLDPNGPGLVDGAKVAAIDSEGLTILIGLLRRSERNGQVIRITNPSRALLCARKALRLHQDLIFEPEQLDDAPMEEGLRLGEVLVRLGTLTEEAIAQAIEESKGCPEVQIGQFLIESGLASESDIGQALAFQHGLHYVEPVEEHALDVTLSHGIPVSELRVHGVLPFLQLGDVLAVAVSDPSDVYATDVIRHYSGLGVMLSVSTANQIQKGLDLMQRANGSLRDEDAAVASTASIQELYDETLMNALIEGASDVHLEPAEHGYLLRYRVDGQLRDVRTFTREEGNLLTARIKVQAGCDISERRLPQDGRIHYTESGRDVDLRVNTLPVVFGEKAVCRVIDRKSGSIPLEKLGIHGQNLEWLREAIVAPHGMVLVTGPTGSGKTTTLYSVLDEIVTPKINVSTVENPVEKTVQGVNQTQVNQKAGLNFSTCLRSLLRQDPDVIMIGEIRDRETAEIAVEAALTGHLVLATLHTNDAPGAASRLIQMGVEPFLVSATLRAVMAQRLVRRLCDACKQEVDLPERVREDFLPFGLKDGQTFAADGCPVCRDSGYDGRYGVYEVVRITDALKDLIAKNPSSAELRDAALASGMISLTADAVHRVNRGETSLQEVLRVAGKE